MKKQTLTPAKLRSIRERLKLNQTEFAEKLGYAHQPRIASLECRENYSPTLEKQLLIRLKAANIQLD